MKRLPIAESDEWLDWYRLTPRQRWQETQKLWSYYLAAGGSLDPDPILKVLSTLQVHRVQCLLMGGQACVYYGGAEFSRDTDIARLAEGARTPSLLREVAGRFPEEHKGALAGRPLLGRLEDEEATVRALVEEELIERERDRLYWKPLKEELEKLRHRRG